MLKSNYPNNNCGECAIWLAIGEPGGISKQEAIKIHCENCPVFLANSVECDGRCLICDAYDAISGCTVTEN